MSQKASTLASVMQSMAGRILFTLINALTGMLTARALHPAGRGELSALGVWPNFLGGLMTLGLPSALVFWTRTDPDRRKDMIWASLPLTIVFSVLAIVVGVIGIPFWLNQYSPHLIFVARIFMLNAFIVLLTANARAVCEAEGDFYASSIALCMPPTITVLGLSILFALHQLTPVSAATIYILSGIPACFYLVQRLNHHFRQRPQWIQASTYKLLSYGIRSYGVDICGTLSLYADQAIVIHYLIPEAMGTYVVALSLSRTLGVIHQTVAAVLFPKAVARELPDMLAMTGRAVRISTSLTMICGGFVALCGPFLLSVLYGKEYKSATTILNILIAEAILTGMALVLTRAYMAAGRPGIVTLLQSSGLILSLPLLMMFVPRYGVLGASFALFIAAVVRLALTLWSFRKVLHVPPPPVVPGPRETYSLCRVALLSAWNRLQQGRAVKEAL